MWRAVIPLKSGRSRPPSAPWSGPEKDLKEGAVAICNGTKQRGLAPVVLHPDEAPADFRLEEEVGHGGLALPGGQVKGGVPLVRLLPDEDLLGVIQEEPLRLSDVALVGGIVEGRPPVGRPFISI